jgi:hypothetical protein
MEVPLLLQDEFFRHLNLRSVNASAAKFHYRHALKQRLRASSAASDSALIQKILKLETKRRKNSSCDYKGTSKFHQIDPKFQFFLS